MSSDDTLGVVVAFVLGCCFIGLLISIGGWVESTLDRNRIIDGKYTVQTYGPCKVLKLEGTKVLERCGE